MMKDETQYESVATALRRVVDQYESVYEAARKLSIEHDKLVRWLGGTMPYPRHYEDVRRVLGLESVIDLGTFLVMTGLEHLEAQQRRPGRR